MPARGQPATLSERVAHIEELLRNLQRLPGATVPQEVTERITTETVTSGGGMAEQMWSKAISTYGSVVNGSGTDSWTDPWVIDTEGGTDLVTVDSLDSTFLDIHHTGYYLLTLTARADRTLAATEHLRVQVNMNSISTAGQEDGLLDLPLVSDGLDLALGQLHRQVHLYDGDTLVSDQLLYDVAADTSLQMTMELSRIGDLIDGLYYGHLP